MKQCPACRTAYTDDSLSYCLADGAALVNAADEEATVVRPFGKEPQPDESSTASDPTIVVPAKQPNASRSSSKWIVLVVAGLLLGVAAVAVLGIAGAAFYYSSAGAPPAATHTPTPRPTSTVDTEKERLRDEIANIQKRIEEQKKSANVPSHTPDMDDDRDEFAVTATVDSPNDGFLALRTYPDPDRGERLARIPHGSEVEIMNCEKRAVVVSGRSGRWCQVEYNGQNGWVFDAWLEY